MNLLWSWLLWLDAEPGRYWTLAWGTFGLTSWLAFRGAVAGPGNPISAPGRFGRPVWFVLMIFVTLAAWRWPLWFAPSEFNPDESQVIAGAITLDKFPVPWKYFDGTTHGPLCEYPLVIAHWLGAPFNHATARIVAALMQGLILLAVWSLLRRFTTERLARVAVLPGLAFWCFVSWEDFSHYSTELPGVLLLAGACASVTAGFFTAEPDWRRLSMFYAGGLCLGAVPFAKLQSLPQALLVAGFVLALLWFAGRTRPGARRRDLPAFVAGGLTMPVITLGFLLIFGLGDQFRTAYIASNVGYTGLGHHPRLEMPGWFFNFAVTSHAFAWFLAGCLGFALLYTRSPAKDTGAVNPLLLGTNCAWLLLGMSYLCVIAPSRDVAHYLQLLVFPATLLAGFVLARAHDGGNAKPAWFVPGPLVVFALLTLAPQVYTRAIGINYFVGELPRSGATLSDTARYIRDRATAADTLAVWGWKPSLFVETQLPQGTRDGNTSHHFTHWPLQDFYQVRYAFDLRRRQPAWFVDAIGPGAFGYDNRAGYGHENFPVIAAIVQTQYELVAEFGSDRIYRLRPNVRP